MSNTFSPVELNTLKSALLYWSVVEDVPLEVWMNEPLDPDPEATPEENVEDETVLQNIRWLFGLEQRPIRWETTGGMSPVEEVERLADEVREGAPVCAPLTCLVAIAVAPNAPSAAKRLAMQFAKATLAARNSEN